MAFAPVSGFTLDGDDFFGVWHIRVERITGLMKFLKRKGETSQSWPDSDGEDGFTDTNDIYFEGRNIMVFCALEGASFALFESQLAAFKAVLEGTGERTLVVPYSTNTYSLMYVDGGDIDMVTPKARSSKYVGRFWVRFRETDPSRGA